uniref:FAD-binding monooxygenase BOA2 ) n=1 Tax=Ganoderma boninense TaxID=34458 RepID=A0A5K1K2G2_9APHY|nr:FAD-binding monooxygenase BOA2 (EC (Botcinic acid biosynthesis cluster A protein 2) [Ganoderma boninense]
MKFSLIPTLAFLVATFAGARAQNISQTSTQCLCTNSKLQQAALSCLEQSCTAQDLQNAESLVQTECSGESRFAFASHLLCLRPCSRLHPPPPIAFPLPSYPCPCPLGQCRLINTVPPRAIVRVGGCSVAIPPSCLDSMMHHLPTEAIIVDSRSYGLTSRPSIRRVSRFFGNASSHSVRALLPSPLRDRLWLGQREPTSPAASQTQSQSQSQSQSQNAAAPTAHAKAKLGAAVVAVAVGAVVGL